MGVDRCLEIREVSISSCPPFDLVDDGVDALTAGVGDSVVEVGKDVGEVALDERSQLLDGSQFLSPYTATDATRPAACSLA